MKLSNAFSLLLDLRYAIAVAFLPTLKAILGRPSLLIRPQALSRIFFAHVWTGFSAGVDEAGAPSKARLLTSRALTTGIVLDIGAGHAHVTAYLPREAVTCYVALEPNAGMHDELRRVAGKNGYCEEDGSLRILGCGADDVDAVVDALGGVDGRCADTMTAVLTLCTIPDAKRVIEELVRRVLKPGGVFMYYEHVRSDREDVAWWQSFWTPLWAAFFDGCCLDRPAHRWVADMKVWSESKAEDKPGEDPEMLFPHKLGWYVKEGGSAENRLGSIQ